MDILEIRARLSGVDKVKSILLRLVKHGFLINCKMRSMQLLLNCTLSVDLKTSVVLIQCILLHQSSPISTYYIAWKSYPVYIMKF
jgi:hypothetical protein